MANKNKYKYPFIFHLLIVSLVILFFSLHGGAAEDPGGIEFLPGSMVYEALDSQRAVEMDPSRVCIAIHRSST